MQCNKLLPTTHVKPSAHVDIGARDVQPDELLFYGRAGFITIRQYSKLKNTNDKHLFKKFYNTELSPDYEWLYTSKAVGFQPMWLVQPSSNAHGENIRVSVYAQPLTHRQWIALKRCWLIRHAKGSIDRLRCVEALLVYRCIDCFHPMKFNKKIHTVRNYKIICVTD